MGFAFTQAAFNTDKARGLNKLVLWIICEHANEKNKDEAWPSIPTIAAEAGVCENTVIKATRFLEAEGLIQVVRTKVTTRDGKPRNLVNRYKPIISAMTEEGGGASDAVPPTACDAVPYSTTCTTPTPPGALPPSAPDAPPYCTTCTVTSNESVMVEPVTVNPVNQKNKVRKQVREKGSEASPPSSLLLGEKEFVTKEEPEPLVKEKWSDDPDVLDLVNVLNPMMNLWDTNALGLEGAFAKRCVNYIRKLDYGRTGLTCGDLVIYNRIHKAPKFPKLLITSCQWLWERVLKEGRGGNVRLVNEYCAHDCESCKECQREGLVSFRVKQKTKQEEAAREREAAAMEVWRTADWERRQKLARYEFRSPTPEEKKQWRALRQGEWPSITPLITPSEGRNAAWDVRHLDAAILICLKINEPQTFEAFSTMVSQINDLDTEIPWETATTD